jgi:hypothetical protein
MGMGLSITLQQPSIVELPIEHNINILPMIECPREFYEKDDIKNEYKCPLTRELMLRPVITKWGYTYDYTAILKQWISEHHSDPTSRDPLSIDDLYNNIIIRQKIEKYINKKIEVLKIKKENLVTDDN